MLSCTDPPSLHAGWHKYPSSFLERTSTRWDNDGMRNLLFVERVCVLKSRKTTRKSQGFGILLEYCRDLIVHWRKSSGNYFSKTASYASGLDLNSVCLKLLGCVLARVNLVLFTQIKKVWIIISNTMFLFFYSCSENKWKCLHC